MRVSFKVIIGALAALFGLVVPVPLWAQEASEQARARLIVATCYTCHREEAGSAAVPTLEGLSAAQIRQALTAYKQDRMQATIMHRVSKALDDAEIEQISALFD